MLIDFTVKNFKSFKNETVFSMEVEGRDKFEEINTVKVRKNKKNHKKELLKSAVIFGANASGKSNFISAFEFLAKYLFEKGEKKFHNNNFRFNGNDKLTEMEINFLVDDEIYNYLITIDLYNKKIMTEKLHIINEKKAEPVFERENNKIKNYNKKIFSNYKRTIDFINESLNDFDSVLTRILEYNSPSKIQKMLSFFENIIFENSKVKKSKKWIGKILYENREEKQKFLNYLKQFGFPIEDIQIENIETEEKELVNSLISLNLKIEDIFSDQDRYKIKFLYKNNDKKYYLDFSEQSEGTQKMMQLYLPIFSVIVNGGVLIIDELDVSLHYKLVCDLLEIFNSIEYNPKNAQIIFTTHNLLLLDLSLFRKDQIWFVENKNIFEGTELYSLSDIKGVGKKDKILRDYLNGFFGGIPNFKKIEVDKWLEKKE